ncbi:hypothetical protein GCM10010359_51350 [Streptomyces morookaense]|nr:hypothetical protein GCM10010359_51350 [Streptomyces morookaense]
MRSGYTGGARARTEVAGPDALISEAPVTQRCRCQCRERGMYEVT